MRVAPAAARPAAVMFALLVLVALGPLGTAQEAGTTCSVPGQVAVEPDGWTRIRAPGFASGPQELTAYAVDPIAPERIFATNGRVLRRSTDGGCLWTTVLSIPPGPTETFPLPDSTTIESIVIPAGSASSSRFHYLVVRETHAEVNDFRVHATVARPGVLRSDDGGVTWERTLVSASGGADFPLGDPIELMVAESAPDIVYLAASVDASVTNYGGLSAGAGGILIYVSRDAGAGWRLAVPEDALEERRLPPVFSDLEVDPLDPERVWGGAEDGLWESGDGGARWERVGGHPSEPVRVIDVFRGPTTARIWTFGPAFSFRSDDGGVMWAPTPTALGVVSAAHGASPDHVFVTDGGGGRAHGYDAAAGGWNVLRQMSQPMLEAAADRAAPPAFYARSEDRIWRYRPPPGLAFGTTPPGGPRIPPGGETPPPSGYECSDADLNSLPKAQIGDPSLLPPDTRLALRPGERARVSYELDLPARPAPVDVYFLVDASGSMGPVICAVSRGVAGAAERLARSGVDAWFGVGTYQGLPPEPYCSHAYLRHHDLAPLNYDFVESLEKVSGCGGNAGEANLTSLVQTVTGEGKPPWIPPGQNANFREAHEPLRVVVHVSDTYAPRGPLHNTMDEAVDALNSKNIRHLGVSIFGNSRNWMREVARRTGAIVESPGVDCDGDGVLDLHPGWPAVCYLPALFPDSPYYGNIPIAEATSAMILALPDEAPVGLVERTDSGVIADISPDLHPPVNLREDNTLPFEVTYTCTEEQAGQIFRVELGGQVREEIVAAATAVVECLDLPEIEVPPIEVPPIVGLAGVPPLVPPPPVPIPAPAPVPAPVPGPVTVPAPAPNPQPQPNPQSQANPQGVLATQKQEQPQAALAKSVQQVAEQEELSMSARSNRRDPLEDARLPLAAGGVLALGFGCVALARRRQHAHSRSR